MKIKLQPIKGYAYGAIQSSVILNFSDVEAVPPEFNKKVEVLLTSLPNFDDTSRFTADGMVFDPDTAPAIFVTIIDMLNHHCGDQRFTPIKVFEEDGMLCFAVPTLSPEISVINSNAIRDLLSKSGIGMSTETIIAFAEKQKEKTRHFLPGGTNAGNFIAAAAERKIPFKIFNQRYIIFSYGCGSRIFNSSITDQESVIGVALAQSKVDTTRLLKMSGFPVAEQARVRTIDDAVRFASKVGYPVVLKPESEGQGRGVFSNILDAAELRESFEKASAEYERLILENFIPGSAYRVHLHNGKVMAVWRMDPPSIIGDGTKSIMDLINIENMKPERISINDLMKPVPIDDITISNLKKLGLTLTSIPSSGEKITLAATSNESRGGSGEDFSPFFHPKNAELCIQAAQTLGLNISGVDLISEDASVPWFESNTVVCEVNSQPQLGDIKSHPELYHDIIDSIPPKIIEVKLKISNTFEPNISNTFNKAASVIEAQCTPHFLLHNGSPTQYFDRIEFSDDVSVAERLKLERMLISVLPAKL